MLSARVLIEIRLVVEHRVLREQDRALQRAADTVHETRARAGPRLLDLPVGDRAGLHLLDLRRRSPLRDPRPTCRAATMPTTLNRPDRGSRRIRRTRSSRAASAGRSPRRTGAAAARQDRGQHRQRVVIGRRARRNLVGHVDAREPRERILECRAALFRLRRLGHVDRPAAAAATEWPRSTSATFSSVVLVSTSPTIAMTALLGA